LIDSRRNDWEQLRTFMQRLKLAGGLWLCRGAVRCSLLTELQDWDDFDVMTEAPEGELQRAIEQSGITASRTFHGGYSFELSTGRKIDVWSLTWTAGRRCTSLAEALSAFEFNVDAIAKSLRSGEINDPLEVQPEIVNRKLRLQGEAQFAKNAYLPLKAAYLVLRHNFTPDESVIRIWLESPKVEGLPMKAVPALQGEISRLGIRRNLAGVQAMARKYPGLANYINLLVSE
jgi:tRNA nucleotidyltransferase/poly(A) polymerase